IYSAVNQSQIFYVLSLFISITILLFDKYNLISIDSQLQKSLMPFISILITAIFTNNYFGIGSNGDNAFSMIKNYFSIGFHPNWRGMLYGTIAMIIMITFRRKFKSAGNIINAALIVLPVTLILSYCLIPDFNHPGISVVNYISPKDVIIRFSIDKNDFSIVDCLKSILTGIALAVSVNQNPSNKLDKIPGLAFAAAGIPYYLVNDKLYFNKKNVVCAAVSFVICVLMLFFKGLPESVCAVILIVGSWQGINWKEFQTNFTSGYNGIISSIIFIIFVFSPCAAITAASIISNIYFRRMNQCLQKQESPIQ
nr:hypothetical protein [Clostridiales bacterium]